MLSSALAQCPCDTTLSGFMFVDPILSFLVYISTGNNTTSSTSYTQLMSILSHLSTCMFSETSNASDWSIKIIIIEAWVACFL